MNDAASPLPVKISMSAHCVFHQLHGRNPTLAEQRAVFNWAARHGFDGIEIADSWDLARLTPEKAAETSMLLAEAGLSISSINCRGKNLANPEYAGLHLAELDRHVQAASWHGCPTLNVSLSVPRRPGVAPVIGAASSPGGSRGVGQREFELSAEGLRQIARRAREFGVELSLELHDRSIADTSANLLRIIEMVGEPNLKVNPDLCNGYRAYDVPSETWQAALVALAPRANLWHVNNLQRVYFGVVRRAAFVECDLASGDIDYVWALNLMRSAGFGGWIVIEYKGLGNALETLTRGRDFLTRIAGDPAIASLHGSFDALAATVQAAPSGRSDLG